MSERQADGVNRFSSMTASTLLHRRHGFKGTYVRPRKERVRVSSSMSSSWVRGSNWFTSCHVSTHNKHRPRLTAEPISRRPDDRPSICRNVSTMRGIHKRVSEVLLLWVSSPASVTTWHAQHCCCFKARLGAKGEMPTVHVSSYVPRSNECKIFFYSCAHG